MKDMVLLRYHNCNQYLHRKSADYRSRVKRKMCAYLAFIQAAVVAQGPRPSIPPSEFVVANALRQSLPDFLLGPAKSDSLTKFIADRQDTQNMRIFRFAGQPKSGAQKVGLLS